MLPSLCGVRKLHHNKYNLGIRWMVVLSWNCLCSKVSIQPPAECGGNPASLLSLFIYIFQSSNSYQ